MSAMGVRRGKAALFQWVALVDLGDVDEANSSDFDCVGKAIAAAARRGLDLT